MKCEEHISRAEYWLWMANILLNDSNPDFKGNLLNAERHIQEAKIKKQSRLGRDDGN